jgi:GTPase SAR1 family protein
MPIEVGKIQFGEIDAKNEVFDQNKIGIQVFHNSFEIPPSVDMEKLTSGAKFFVYGQKGCGKTALLLHLKKLLDDSGATTRTILFKSGITEPERQSIASGKGFEIVEQDNIRSVEYDYKINWLWYIYRNLLRMMNPKDSDENSDIIISLKKIIGVHGEIKTSLLSDLTTKSIKSFARASFTAAGSALKLALSLSQLRMGHRIASKLKLSIL